MTSVDVADVLVFSTIVPSGIIEEAAYVRWGGLIVEPFRVNKRLQADRVANHAHRE